MNAKFLHILLVFGLTLIVMKGIFDIAFALVAFALLGESLKINTNAAQERKTLGGSFSRSR